jgi:Tol biopolymer transport system component
VRAIWTPDGARVTYASATAGVETLFWRPANGSGPAEPLATSEYSQYTGSWSPDGQTLAFVQATPESTGDIWVLPLSGDRQPRPILQTRFDESYAEFSPDGGWLAYASNESSRSEVYVQPYPGPGSRELVSTDGGTAPGWARHGRELFYTTTQTIGGQAAPTRMMVVPITLGTTFSVGAPRMLFEGRYGATCCMRPYDVTADGRRFLMLQQKERPPVSVSNMVLVQNWVEELKARVPVK